MHKFVCFNSSSSSSAYLNPSFMCLVFRYLLWNQRTKIFYNYYVKTKKNIHMMEMNQYICDHCHDMHISIEGPQTVVIRSNLLHF